MSLVTRCPACSTQFKVVPDQIRIAVGWVRCGHCGEVFEASAHMQLYDQRAGTAIKPLPPRPAPESGTSKIQRASAVPEPPGQRRVAPPPKENKASATFQPVDLDLGAEIGTPKLTLPVTSDPSEQDGSQRMHTLDDWAPDTRLNADENERNDDAHVHELGDWTANTRPDTDEEKQKDNAHVHKLGDVPPDSQPDGNESEPKDSTRINELDDWAANAGPETNEEIDQTDTPVPLFVADAQRRAFWSSHPIRKLARPTLALLALVLVAQMALSQRDWLAVRAPLLAPALRALCAPLGCSVQPYRHLDSIVIDGMAFHRAGDNSFRLSVTLRNGADFPVASPALELTLTDAEEQPLVRRVVTATELGAPPALDARGEFSGVRVLSMNEDAHPEAVVNYRLAVFYP
jgi:predicted Zn finger-like uncharacterized protein